MNNQDLFQFLKLEIECLAELEFKLLLTNEESTELANLIMNQDDRLPHLSELSAFYTQSDDEDWSFFNEQIRSVISFYFSNVFLNEDGELQLNTKG